MKKKFGIIAFIAVCTVALTFGIASFTLGADEDVTGSSSGGNLSAIYDSHVSQVQRIIDNSNLSGDYTTDITNYHIVQIVDSLDAVDTENKALYEYLVNYINNANDEQTITSGNFRTDIIGAAMKAGTIDIQTFAANDADLDEAIGKADLVYIACNASYTSSCDLTADAVNALETYALTDFKPVMVDKELVGETSTSEDTQTESYTPPIIADYVRKLYNRSNDGTYSFKTSDQTWEQYFDTDNTKTTYTTFNNKGNYVWNQFDYDGGYQHKVLEIVAKSSDGKTSFETCVEDGTFGGNAFSNPVDNENIAYQKVTITEFLQLIENQYATLKAAYEQEVADGVRNSIPEDSYIYKHTLYDYDFVYLDHSFTEEVYVNGSNDFTENGLYALKGFIAKTQKEEFPDVSFSQEVKINRLMIDAAFLSVYKPASSSSSSSSSTTTTVDTSTEAYKFVTKMIATDASSAYVRNVEIINRGYFGSMTPSKASRITNLINRSSYRSYTAGNGSTFKVLEIQPYYTVTDTEWYNKKMSELTNTLENPAKQEINVAKNQMFKEGKLASDSPYYTFTLTEARVAAATGLNTDQISIKSVSASQLNTMSMNMLEEYDMIYIGGVNANVKSKTDWNSYKMLTTANKGDFNYRFLSTHIADIYGFYLPSTPSSYEKISSKLNNAYVYPCYTHTGDFVAEYDQFSGFCNYVGNNYEQSVVRLNGNDITAKMYAQLYSYIRAGMPVVIDDNVLDSDYLIGGSSVNANLVEDASYRIEVDDNLTVNRLKLDATVDENAPLEYLPKGMQSTQTITYRKTSYSDKSMVARRESTIDPESYIYQLMYQIAENQNSGIYHANNVLIGFDDKDTVKVANYYLESATSDDQETVPDNIEDMTDSNKSQLVPELSDEQYNGYSDSVEIFSNKVEKTLLGGIDYAKSGAGIQLKHFLNQYAVSRPVINLLNAPKDYNSEATKEENDNNHSPTFTFSITGNPSETYTVRLYYDFNADGKYSDYDVEGRYDRADVDSQGNTVKHEKVAETTCQVGSIISFTPGSNGGSVDMEIPDDFVGVMPYKLVVTDSTGKKTAVVGYPKYYSKNDAKQTIRLLQIIPGFEHGGVNKDNLNMNVHGDTALNKEITTLCVEENTIKNAGKLKNHTHTFGLTSATDSSDNLASRLEEEYDIKLDVMTTGQFSELSSLYIQDYCNHFDEYKVRDELDEDEISKFEQFMSKYFNANTGKLNNDWADVISWTNETVYDFYEDLGICDKIFSSWLVTGDDSRTITLDTKDYDGNPQTYSLGGYKMIIIGFAQRMGGTTYARSDMTNIACQFIRAYSDSYGQIFLGTDSLSYNGFYTAHGGTMCWSRNINQYLRKSFGMDRFKFVSENGKSAVTGTYTTGQNTNEFYAHLNDGDMKSGVGKAFLYTPYNSDTPKSVTGVLTDQLYPGEYFTTNSYDGTYEVDEDSQTNFMSGAGGTDALFYAQATLNSKNSIFEGVTLPQEQKQSGDGLYNSTRIAQNNSGLMTKYPFNISSHPDIARADAQSYALDLEDNEMTVWYTLAGDTDTNSSQLFTADPLNGRSHYYIYTYRNVTFTAAGYSAVAETANNDDERKLIINAILKDAGAAKRSSNVRFVQYPYDDADKGNFTPANATSSAVLECNGDTSSSCNFGFQITVPSGRTITKAVLFIDANEDGDYSADDFKLEDYPNANESLHLTGNSCTVAVKGADLPTLNSYMSRGDFYIYVKITDSEGRTDIEKLLVKPTQHLFDLH